MSSKKDVLSDILGDTEEEEMISIDEILERARTAAPEEKVIPLEDILGSAYAEASAVTRFEEATPDGVFPESVETSVHSTETARSARPRRSGANAASQRARRAARRSAADTTVSAEIPAPSSRRTARRRSEEERQRAHEQAVARADYFMTIAALLMTLFFYVTQYLMAGTSNYALCATILGSLAVEKGVLGVKTNNRSDKIRAAVYGAVTVLAAVMHFVAMKK